MEPGQSGMALAPVASHQVSYTRLIDNKKIRLRDTGTALARDLVTALREHVISLSSDEQERVYIHTETSITYMM